MPVSAVKRLMREAIELKDATSDYFAQPLSDNLFEWHFTVRGPSDTEFEGGIYHGRIILPTDYPMKPPHIIVLTVRVMIRVFCVFIGDQKQVDLGNGLSDTKMPS